jgi:hypothetical protein
MIEKPFFSVLFAFSTLLNSSLYAQAPSGLHHQLTSEDNTSATLFWSDNSTNETGFSIERKYDGASWTEVATTGANTTTISLNLADPVKSADYRVKAMISGNSEAVSNTIRLVGTGSELEVYPEVPGIRNPEIKTINGITFPEIQYQCPAEPDKGFATRISTFYKVEVQPSSGGEFKYSPAYETRPQIRDLRPQNSPDHSGGHDVYAYGNYGPSSDVPSRTLHSRHWTNFDANTETVVRITLLEGAISQTVNLSDTEIYPAPIAINQVNTNSIDITLPAAGNEEMDFARNYMVTFNRKEWEDPDRGPYIYEHPIMIFVNPVKIAPGSAAPGTFKEYDGGKLLIMGSGIHLPNDRWRFLGNNANNAADEVYVPGDAYLHGGFALNSTVKPVKIWGRGIYSDEMFLVHQENDNFSGRTPWATIRPAEGNPWNLKGTWEASIFFGGNENIPQTVEGLSSISRRMGSVTKNGGNGRLLDHKDVGYAGGLYQEGNTKSYYSGIYTHNDDDITYMHEDWEMHYSTTRNLHNGPSFQFGWGVDNEPNAKGRAYNHTVLPPDKRDTGFGQNHGVFNSRLQAGALIKHLGGYFENIQITGTENIVFNIGISQERGPDNPPQNFISVFSDKTFKNVSIENPSRNKNLLETEVDPGTNQKSYIRFLHFDNLVIGGQSITNIDDGDHFDYNEKLSSQFNTNGVLLHTITFFSLPDPVIPGQVTVIKPGFSSGIRLASTEHRVFANYELPQSLGPLCATDKTSTMVFEIVDAGEPYVALKTPEGYFIKADPKRYGYMYTQPDPLRGESGGKTITDDAKFLLEHIEGQQFALYAESMNAYVRVETNCGPEMPLYAASATIGEMETFTFDEGIVFELSEEEVIEEPVLSTIGNDNQLKVYPNPVRDYVYVETKSTSAHPIHVRLMDLSGRTMLTFDNSTTYNQSSKIELNLTGFSAGTYLLQIKGTKNEAYLNKTFRVIIN